jgi:flagellar protein FliS
MAATGIQAYKKLRVQTAHPAQLVVMLYEEGAIRALQNALDSLDRKELAGAHNWLVRAQEVVFELRATLNYDAGPIAVQLGELYDVFHRQLVLANVRKDAQLTREVLGHFRELLPAWQAAAQTVMAGATPTPARAHGG